MNPPSRCRFSFANFLVPILRESDLWLSACFAMRCRRRSESSSGGFWGTWTSRIGLSLGRRFWNDPMATLGKGRGLIRFYLLLVETGLVGQIAGRHVLGATDSGSDKLLGALNGPCHAAVSIGE